MMINCFIGTYDNIDLSIGAAKSLKTNITNPINITLINGGLTTIDNPIFNNIVNIKFPRWFGFIPAQKLSSEDNINIYIDDDIRLLSNIDISKKYTFNNNEYYMPNNGYMVQIWRKIYNSFNKCKQIPVTRIRSLADIASGDIKLKELAYKNSSQTINDIWLHLDKGSESMTQTRKDLINYIDKDE